MNKSSAGSSKSENDLSVDVYETLTSECAEVTPMAQGLACVSSVASTESRDLMVSQDHYTRKCDEIEVMTHQFNLTMAYSQMRQYRVIQQAKFTENKIKDEVLASYRTDIYCLVKGVKIEMLVTYNLEFIKVLVMFMSNLPHDSHNGMKAHIQEIAEEIMRCRDREPDLNKKADLREVENAVSNLYPEHGQPTTNIELDVSIDNMFRVLAFASTP